MIKAGNAVYSTRNDLPEVLPVFPLTGALLLPGGQMPLNIFEQRYLDMINAAMATDRLIGMVQPDLKTNSTDGNAISEMGCIGRISALQESGDGRYLISLSGVCRFKPLEEVSVDAGYRSFKIDVVERDLLDLNEEDDVNREELITAFRSYLSGNGMDADWGTINQTNNSTLVTALCMMSPYGPAEKQALLEAPDLKSRADTLIALTEIYLARQGDSDEPLQ